MYVFQQKSASAACNVIVGLALRSLDLIWRSFAKGYEFLEDFQFLEFLEIFIIIR